MNSPINADSLRPVKRCKLEYPISTTPASPSSTQFVESPQSPPQDQEPEVFPPHPLLMDVILERISEHFDYSTLKSARTVCSQWNNILFRRFRKRTTLHIEFNIFTKSILDFTTTFAAPSHENKAYKKIQLVTPERLDYPLMVKWMSEYGKYIEHIKLGCDPPSDENLKLSFSSTLQMSPAMYGITLKSLKMLLLTWCPQLKVLLIPLPYLLHQDQDNTSSSNSSTLSIKEDRFSPVVQLDCLQIGTSGFDSRSISNAIEPLARRIFCFVKSIDTLRLLSTDLNDHGLSILFSDSSSELSVISTISNFNVSGYPVRPDVFKTLSKLKLSSLSSISISKLTSYSTEDAESFGGFLSAFGSQLKSVSLCNHTPTFPPLMSLSPWANSTLIHLKLLKIAIDKWDFGSADFLIQLPNLEELWIYTGEEEGSLSNASDVLTKRLFLPNSNLKVVKHRGLRKLFFRCVTTEMTVIRGIVESFPNLVQFQKLHIAAEKFNDALQLLSGLENLEQLQIFISVNKQVACVGHAIIANMQHFKQLRSMSLEVQKKRLVAGHPGYGNLRLRLGSTCFTKGFLKSPHLTSLQLTRVQIPLLAYNIVMNKKCKLRVKLIRSFIRT